MDSFSIADIALLRKDDAIGVALKQELAHAKATNRRRRELVLSHPDLAARLTQSPHHWSHPERWNGYIPPEFSGDMPNRSPVRKALLDLVAEAEARGGRQAPPSLATANTAGRWPA